MTREIFAEGLARLAIATRTTLESAAFEVYHDALDAETTASEWAEVCRWAVSADRFTWFPKVIEIHDALREFRGETPLALEAVTAYERVLEAGSYTPDGGTSWTWRGVLAACGRAAADAWLEAGGDHAFRSTWDEAKRRERFVDAYQQTVRAEPSLRLLPAGESERAALPAPVEPSAEAAASLVQKIAGKVEPKFTRKPVSIDINDPQTAARIAALRAQAAEIVEQEAVAK